MKSSYLLALAMLALFVFAGGIAYADQYDYNYYYPGVQAPRMTQPAATGAGPTTCCPARMVNPCPPGDSCNIAPAGTCGAFCAAGQNPQQGWPYNWCSEYWLRPNSNF